MVKLGVNIDHAATLRQARREKEPDPILAARLCEQAGADSIVAHLREDRRHINDEDVRRLRKNVRTRFNLEMSIAPKIVEIALKLKPDQVTLVPERRQEITTEGGLDLTKNSRRIEDAAARLSSAKIPVSLFIDPVEKQIQQAKKIKVSMIELHTGAYAKAVTKSTVNRELQKLTQMTQYAHSLGLVVNAGHGLNYKNVQAVAKISGIEELNIGHSIISRAVFVGLETAVQEMIALMRGKEK